MTKNLVTSSQTPPNMSTFSPPGEKRPELLGSVNSLILPTITPLMSVGVLRSCISKLPVHMPARPLQQANWFCLYLSEFDVYRSTSTFSTADEHTN